MSNPSSPEPEQDQDHAQVRDASFGTVLDEHMRAGYQAFFIPTTEESRVENELSSIAQEHGAGYITWDCIHGFSVPERASKDPKLLHAVAALKAIVDDSPNAPFDKTGQCIFHFKDLTDFQNDPNVRRVIRGLCEGNKLVNRQWKRWLVITSPSDKLHDALKPCLTPVEFKLPDETMLSHVVQFVKCSVEDSPSHAQCDDDLVEDIIAALRGLTTTEAENVLSRCLVRHRGFCPEILDTIRDEKAAIIKKSEILTYIPETDQATREEIGGFGALMTYLDRRRLAYGKDARAIGLDFPKGIVLAGVPGTGKCLGRGTPVLMHDGTVKCAENVIAHDKLMGPDGTARTVLSTTEGCGPLYCVTPRKGDPYVVNVAHMLSLKRTGTEEIVNLSVQDYLRKGEAAQERLKGWRTDANWPAQPVIIPPYILGVWLGDGTSTAPYVTTADKEIVAELAYYADTIGVNFRDYGEKGRARTYGLTKDKGRQNYNGNAFYEGLRQYALFANKHIPQSYLANDRCTRLELLAGLIDTDGHLNCGGYEIPTKFGQLASDILFLARSLGFAAYSTPREKYDQHGRGGIYHHVFISGHTEEIPVRIPRKQASTRQQPKDVLKTGITVEPCGDGDYFGFELDGDRLFLLGDFTVTHNSYVAFAVGRLLGLPSFIMDISSVFGSLVGESESRMRAVMRQVEAQQGCVLVIDEADKALGGSGGSANDSGVTQRVFGQLLTWLATKRDRTFVIVTLNRTKGIPPEFFRAGRFDSVWFTDLPTEAERRTILEIHFRKRGIAPEQLQMGDANWADLIEATHGYVGSELEEMVREARYLAFDNRRGQAIPNFEEMMAAKEAIVPITVLDSENVTEMREYLRVRCNPVSTPDIGPVPVTKPGRKQRDINLN